MIDRVHFFFDRLRDSLLWGRTAGMMAVLGLAWGLGAPPPVQAQTQTGDSLRLIERYRTARVQTLARQALRRGWRARALPADSVPVRRPPLLRRSADADTADEETPSDFPLQETRAVGRLEREWFATEFKSTNWSFLGSSSYLTVFDTTYTRELRARLQAQFGDPTQTLADLPDTSRAGEPQFEYWFVVNDSVPVRVSDPNGPRDRGLIVATERRLRDRLPALRAALLRPLRQPERAPYVDYYTETTDDGDTRWYRTGFDGRSYFMNQIQRTDILTGRRPHVEPAGPADSTDASSPDTDRSGPH
ncbi:MAG: hypothetical protein R6T83_02915 [Salinibacter sp.]